MKYPQLKNNDINYQILPVNYAFHSTLIDQLSDDLKEVYSEYKVRQPIRFRECIQGLDEKEHLFIDLSPDGEISGMLKYILTSEENIVRISSIFNTMIDVDKVVEEIKVKGVHKMKAYVFAGQGSQYKGMGEGLFDEFPELTQKADEILGYSIKDLCLNDSEGKLSNTAYTQPALFVVSVLSYLKDLKDAESKPDYLAGHSIGEYAALCASGAIDFETGVRLVQKRGELMAKAAGGGMAAVVGLTKEEVEQTLKDSGCTQVDIANMNTPKQIVLSGKMKDIEGLAEAFTSNLNCRMYKVLNVSGAFHSRYMQDALDEFRKFLNKVEIKKMEIPVISNVYARPYKEKDFHETLAIQLVSSVQWTDSIRYLMAKGVEDIKAAEPGKVVKGMVQRILREAAPLEKEIIEAEEVAERLESSVDEKVNTEEVQQTGEITAYSLGDANFKKEYGLKYAYVVGGMGNGVSDEKLVIQTGKGGVLGFYGTSGVDIEEVEAAIKKIQSTLKNNEPYGFNVTYDVKNPNVEEKLYDTLLKYNVNVVEAAGYVMLTKALVKYRVKGLVKGLDGTITAQHKIIAKISRPEVAEYFMSPPPYKIVQELLQEGEISDEEAELSQRIPMASDLCVESAAAGYTDTVNMLTLLPSINQLKETVEKEYKYQSEIRIGVSGGIGTPNAAATMFMMGASFILTGSINECTVEANISNRVKEMLSSINVQDIGYVQHGMYMNLIIEFKFSKKVHYFG